MYKIYFEEKTFGDANGTVLNKSCSGGTSIGAGAYSGSVEEVSANHETGMVAAFHSGVDHSVCP